VTQQNASSSEEMASTAEELASQADHLQNVIAFFRVDSAVSRTSRGRTSKERFAQAGGKPVAAKLTHEKQVSMAAKSATASKVGGAGVNIKMTEGKDDVDSEFEKF